jgi:putative phosphoribosyl transferase
VVMSSRGTPFADRREAGVLLGAELAGRDLPDPVVLGLARGGVPVAAEVAAALGAPLDVLVARKIGAPVQPELGIGAIAEGGVAVIDRGTVAALGVGDRELEALAAREQRELERRVRAYRGERPAVPLEGRTAVVVDDGLATGVTAAAGAAAAERRGAARVVIAVPVCAPETAEALGGAVDEVVCLMAPPTFRAVGAYYEDFGQLADEDVTRALSGAG